MRREVVRSVFVGLGLLGLVLSAHGAWIPAKAWLAQRLLERAWHRAGAGEAAPRPWPWADTWPVARLRAPSRDVSLLVLEGASGETLAFGPGRHPQAGEIHGPGNLVLAGHRDTHFRFLSSVEAGELLIVETPDGRAAHYRVAEVRVAHERETWLLEGDAPGQLTLLTCYPFDALLPGGPLRFAVLADRVPAPARQLFPASRRGNGADEGRPPDTRMRDRG